MNVNVDIVFLGKLREYMFARKVFNKGVWINFIVPIHNCLFFWDTCEEGVTVVNRREYRYCAERGDDEEEVL